MGGKKKAAKIAAKTASDAAKVAEKRYKEAKSGKMPSQVAIQGRQQVARMRIGMQGMAKGARSGFQSALSRRQAMQGYAQAAPQTLGQIASAKAQEQLGLMGAAQGHQFGMIANKAQYQASAHSGELVQGLVGAAGAAASSFI